MNQFDLICTEPIDYIIYNKDCIFQWKPLDIVYKFIIKQYKQYKKTIRQSLLYLQSKIKSSGDNNILKDEYKKELIEILLPKYINEINNNNNDNNNIENDLIQITIIINQYIIQYNTPITYIPIGLVFSTSLLDQKIPIENNNNNNLFRFIQDYNNTMQVYYYSEYKQGNNDIIVPYIDYESNYKLFLSKMTISTYTVNEFMEYIIILSRVDYKIVSIKLSSDTIDQLFQSLCSLIPIQAFIILFLLKYYKELDHIDFEQLKTTNISTIESTIRAINCLFTDKFLNIYNNTIPLQLIQNLIYKQYTIQDMNTDYWKKLYLVLSFDL